MPAVKKGEKQSHYMHRCVPMLVREGKSHEQAVAQCLSMFRQKWKAKGVDFKDNDEMMEQYMRDDNCPECDEYEVSANHRRGIFEIDFPNEKLS